MSLSISYILPIFFLLAEVCSQRRINNGSKILIEEVPYQVVFQKWYEDLKIRQQFCGGSLVSELYVLSAAHCFEGQVLHELEVRIGSEIQNEGGEVIPISRIVSHPKYSNLTTNYDFAVAVLEYSVKFSPKIQPIQLPTEGDETQPGELVVVSGWGDSEKGVEDELKGVTVQIIDSETCAAVFENYSEYQDSSEDPIITDQMICAGTPEELKDACEGDSGGPLVRKSDGVLIGVVSFGVRCSEKVGVGTGVYAKVASVREWIGEITGL